MVVRIKRQYIIFGINRKTNKREKIGTFREQNATKAVQSFKRSEAGSVAAYNKTSKHKLITAQRF